MQTLSDADLEMAPARLLDDARRGETTLVTSQGRPMMLAVPLTDGSPTREALVDLACALYERGEISTGVAARIAGLSQSDMIDEFGRRGLAIARYSADDMERELVYAATVAGRR